MALEHIHAEHRHALGSSVVEGLCWTQGRTERQTTPMKILPSISTYWVGKTSQRCTKNIIQCKFVQWYKTHSWRKRLFFPVVGIRVSNISRVQLLDALDTDYSKERRVHLTGAQIQPTFWVWAVVCCVQPWKETVLTSLCLRQPGSRYSRLTQAQPIRFSCSLCSKWVHARSCWNGLMVFVVVSVRFQWW